MENKEEKIFLTKEEALRIANIIDNKIHNFVSTPFALIGADWSEKDFKKKLKLADNIEVGGTNCRSMKHALVLSVKKEQYFFEHKEEELKKLLIEKGLEEVK